MGLNENNNPAAKLITLFNSSTLEFYVIYWFLFGRTMEVERRTTSMVELINLVIINRLKYEKISISILRPIKNVA